MAINFANPQEHVPEAERKNRVIKERVRATYRRLPYIRLTKLLVKMLVTESAKKLNFFPAKNGVSQYYSPRMILHQRNLDYGRHCQYAMGAYVQAHDEPKISKTNPPRKLDCIYVRYNDNAQGGHELLHLPTNSVLTRRNVNPVPIKPGNIKHLHTLAEREGMPDGLKIENRTGQLFYNSAWITGVDYHEEEFEDDFEEDYEDEDSVRDDDKLPDAQFEEVDPDELTEVKDPDQDDDDDEDNNDQGGNAIIEVVETAETVETEVVNEKMTNQSIMKISIQAQTTKTNKKT